MRPGLACLAIMAAILVRRMLLRMPAPYDDVSPVDIEPDRLSRFPGSENGSPFPPNLTGVFARNDRLRSAKRLFEGQVLGSESVAVKPDGTLVMLDRYGYLHTAQLAGESYELRKNDPPLYIGPGRPLGFHVVEAGEALLVCDSLKGLLRVEITTGAIGILGNRITDTGEPINYANDLDVASDGTVYFTSSTAGAVARGSGGFYDTMHSFLMNSMRGDASGRLLEFNPATRKVRALMTKISYANGVAVSADGSFVAVVETHTCRVLRHWLTGPKKGTDDTLIEKLPGFPDGITKSADGNFWVSLVVPLSPFFRVLGPYKFLRAIASHAISTIFPYVAKKWGCIVKVSPLGEPLETLMDPDGTWVSSVSAVTEHNGTLFLGNLGGDHVSILKL